MSKIIKKIASSLGLLISQPALLFLYNFLLVMVLFMLWRVFFFFVNKSYFPEVDMPQLIHLLKGGLQFDLSALLYVNLVYLAMQLTPFRFRSNPVFQQIARWVFLSTNSIALIVNCMDIPFFRFSNRRTTVSIFSEFGHEGVGNLSKIILEASVEYWYVTLFAVVAIAALFLLYRKPLQKPAARSPYYIYYPVHIVLFVVFVYYTVIGIRGGFGSYTRPITVSNAAKYTNKGAETAIVLNTPFCLIRTLETKVFVNPKYFDNQAEMIALYTPLHYPKGCTGEAGEIGEVGARATGKAGKIGEVGETGDPRLHGNDMGFIPLNVVVIIWESLGKEYTGFFNPGLNSSNGCSFTPFLDSLLAEGLTFRYSFSNGVKSIDAMPAVLSSIPMFVEPFILTSYSTNDISSLADVLKRKGYYTAFFHGAPNGSMGFEAYAKMAGFNDYFGYEKYNNSSDYDGWWAIWDEEFLQYYAQEMGAMKQPFFTSVFTASSHHPFQVPKKYEGRFPKGDHPVLECMAYTDYALRRFFEKMSQYEWFANTLFVITADHTSAAISDEYANSLGRFSIPILFYRPDGSLKDMVDLFPVQQIDIMPSVLSYLHYDRPFFAYGQDVFTTKAGDKFAVNYNNGDYQLLKNGYMKQFNGEKTKAIYNYVTDPALKNNLSGTVEAQNEDEALLKSIIQQYIERMLENRMRD